MRHAIIDGPFLTLRAYKANGIEAMFKASLSTIFNYLDVSSVWVVWEPPDGTGNELRRKILPDYKTGRPPKAEEYFDALADLVDGLKLLGVHQAFPKEGEADDAAATLAWRFKAAGHHVELWAADHDWLQLVAEGIDILRPGCGGNPDVFVTIENCRDLTGHTPAGWLDLLSLWGCPGDRVPGLPRIGEQRASDTIAAVPDCVELILSGQHEKARAQAMAVDASVVAWVEVAIERQDIVRATRDLVTLVEVPLQEMRATPRPEAAREWLESVGVAGLADRVDVGDSWGEPEEPGDDWS